MALTLIEDSKEGPININFNEILKISNEFRSKLQLGLSASAADDPTVSPVMKETTTQCRCKSSSCNCARRDMMPPNNLPLDFDIRNLLAQSSVFPSQNELMLRALISSRDPYASEMFTQNWSYQSQHVVSSSDQIIREHSPTKSHKRVKDISSAPSSPPISTTSPFSDKKLTDGSSLKKFRCEFCSKSFDYKHVLQNHKRTHTGEKPFGCTICWRRFKRDHHLKTHMRLHTGEKPFQCEYCDMRFVQVANLKRHTLTHTKERPFQCDSCDARFADSNQKKTHMLLHTGEKPFLCSHCNGRFRRKHHLQKHKCRKSTDSPYVVDSDIDTSKSDDAVSSDSAISTNSNDYQHPLVTPVFLSTVPKIFTMPMQTEPEDLSVKKYNNSSSSTGGSSRSTSPSAEYSSSPICS